MSYVVDIQGFHAPNFLPKEICVVAVHSSFTWHRMIRPPICYNRLSSRMKKQVDFVTRNIHGLHWNLGYTSESDALTELKEIIQGAAKVYIKGSERATYLKKLINYSVPVVDLDIYDYRGPRELKEFCYVSCSRYLHRHSELRCAYRKACMYRDHVCKLGYT